MSSLGSYIVKERSRDQVREGNEGQKQRLEWQLLVLVEEGAMSQGEQVALGS